MSSFLIPSVDKTRYIWHSSPHDDTYYVREAWGSEVIEDIWNRYNHAEQNLFLGVNITLSKPVTTSELLERARDAWMAVRFSTPIIAAHTEQDKADNTLITYRLATDAADAQAWARRTIRFHEIHKDLDELRFEIGQKPTPEENGDQTFIYFVSRSDTSYGVLMHTSHVPFDGAGTKIIMNRFLNKLAQYIAEPSLTTTEKFAWGTEAVKLPPAAGQILGQNEAAEGSDYAATLTAIMTDLGAAMPRQHGFKTRNVGPGPTRRLSFTFTAEETSRFIQFTRSSGFTVNHVVHAALMMVCALDNPPSASTPSDAAFVFYGLADCRSRLSAEYSGKNGYPGYCLGMSPIVVPLSLFTSAAPDGERAQLLQLTSAVKSEYVKQKNYPALLAVIGQEVDMMLAPLRAGGPLPPPWMGPWFAGDGIGETYIDPVHADSKENVVIQVDDFFTSLNKTDPGPFFRTFSWAGRLTVSTDYNEHAMPRHVVQTWMDKWVELIRLTM